MLYSLCIHEKQTAAVWTSINDQLIILVNLTLFPAYCKKGYVFNSGTERCDKCLVGEYKDTEGNDVGCTTCPDDVTTIAEGATAATDCSKGLVYSRK